MKPTKLGYFGHEVKWTLLMELPAGQVEKRKIIEYFKAYKEKLTGIKKKNTCNIIAGRM